MGKMGHGMNKNEEKENENKELLEDGLMSLNMGEGDMEVFY